MKILTVFKYEFLSVKNFVSYGGWARKLVVILFLLIISLVSVGIFAFFIKIFEFISSQEQGLQVLTFYSVAAAFFLIFGLLIVSNALFLSGQLFSFRGNNNLLSLPLSPVQTFFIKFIPAVFLASWPIYVVGIPTILALLFTFGSSLFTLVGAILLLSPLVLIALSWSTILVFVLNGLIGKLTFRFILILAVILLFILSSFTVNTLFPNNIELIFETLDKVQARETLLSFAIFSDLLPSAWFTKGIWGLVEPTTNLFLGSLVLLWLLSFVSFLLVLILVRIFYLPLLQKTQEGALIASPSSPESFRKISPVKFSHLIVGNLIKKEVTTLFRDSRRMSYFWFLLLIMTIYFFALLRVPDLNSLEPSFAGFILAGNFSFIAYFQTILSLKFAYPSMSMEGKSAWVLWSLPIRLDKILRSKALVFVPGVILVGLTMNFVSGIIFSYNPFLWWTSLAFSLIVGAFVSSIALSFGTFFPSFDETDQDAASTSAPGLLATTLSLLTVASFSFVLWNFYNGYFFLRLSDTFNIQPVLDFIIVSGVYTAAMIWFLFFFAGRKLKSYDF